MRLRYTLTSYALLQHLFWREMSRSETRVFGEAEELLILPETFTELHHHSIGIYRGFCILQLKPRISDCNKVGTLEDY